MSEAEESLLHVCGIVIKKPVRQEPLTKQLGRHHPNRVPDQRPETKLRQYVAFKINPGRKLLQPDTLLSQTKNSGFCHVKHFLPRPPRVLPAEGDLRNFLDEFRLPVFQEANRPAGKFGPRADSQRPQKDNLARALRDVDEPKSGGCRSGSGGKWLIL